MLRSHASQDRLDYVCVLIPGDSECRALGLPDDPGEQMHKIARPHDFLCCNTKT